MRAHPMVVSGCWSHIQSGSRMNKVPKRNLMPFANRAEILSQNASLILVMSENGWIPRVC